MTKDTPQRGRGRPKAEIDALEFYRLASVGTPNREIAEILEIDPRTLRRHLQSSEIHTIPVRTPSGQVSGTLEELLRRGDAAFKVNIRATLFRLAMRGNWKALKFLIRVSGIKFPPPEPQLCPNCSLLQRLSRSETAVDNERLRQEIALLERDVAAALERAKSKKVDKAES